MAINEFCNMCSELGWQSSLAAQLQIKLPIKLPKAEQLIHQAAAPLTKSLISSGPQLEGRIEEILSEPG